MQCGETILFLTRSHALLLAVVPGFYRPKNDTTGLCIACPPGFESGIAAAECTPCPVGTISPVPGSASCSNVLSGQVRTARGANRLPHSRVVNDACSTIIAPDRAARPTANRARSATKE